MAYRVKRPFNLLFLEEAEEYFSDFAASLFIKQKDVPDKQVDGRLRICSKSLVFDPDDVSSPILKFLYRFVTETRPDRNGKPVFKVDSSRLHKVPTTTADLNTRCVIPYDVVPSEGQAFIFSVHYGEIGQFFPLIESLIKASKLPMEEYLSEVQRMLSKVSSSLRFDQSQLDHREKILTPAALWVTRIKPLMCHRGLLMITSSAVYYQPYPNFSSKSSESFKLSEILQVFPRHYSLKPTALEIVTSSKQGLFIRFESEAARSEVQQILHQQVARLPTQVVSQLTDVRAMTSLWQRGELSNYHYLDFLNSAAGRSRNDLSQYPVFPWVISDYQSRVLDLEDRKMFRDLSKPIGALNPKRFQYFTSRIDTMSDDEVFLYGTHYSNPSYVLYWLLRVMPECMLRLHGGKFDASARLFHSLEGSWTSCYESTSTLMELVPEFFELPTPWLFNSLGISPKDAPINDVKLPPWARDAEDFVVKMRAALESEEVSQNLPKWIDLIFGVSSQGGGRNSPAFRSKNLFHPVCYAAREFANDPMRGRQKFDMPQHILEAQVTEFGSVPQQLFHEPHPPRLLTPKWNADSLRSDPSLSSPWYVVAKPDEKKEPPRATPAPVSTQRVPSNNVDRATPLGSPRSAPVQAEYSPVANASAEFKVQREIDLHCEGITDLAVSPSTIFASGLDGGLRTLSYRELPPAAPTSPPPAGGGGYSSFSERLNQRRLTQPKTFHVSSQPLTAVSILDRNPSSVCVGGADDAVTIYSIKTGRGLHRQVVHSDTVSVLCSHGDQIVSGSQDQTVRTWSLADGHLQEREAFDDLQDTISSVSAFGNIVAAGSKNGGVAIWDDRSCDCLFSRPMGQDAVEQVQLGNSGGVACGLDAAGQFLVWDLRVNAETLRLRVPTGTCSVVTDCKSWALFGGKDAVYMWSLANQKCVGSIQLSHAVDFLSLTPDAKTYEEVVAGSASGKSSFMTVRDL